MTQMHHADQMFMKDYTHEGTNEKIVVFIHGIYSCPAQFEMFYPLLKDKGYSIYALLLQGHGNDLSKLIRVNYRDWEQQVDHLLHDLSKKYDNIYVIGHSMGGLLSLDTKDEYLTKRILIAPAVCVKMTWRYLRLGILINNQKIKDSFIEDSRRRCGVIFPKSMIKKIMMIFSFWQLLRLKHYVHIKLKHIHKPLLIIQSYNDECVKTTTAKRIIRNVSSEEKYVLWLKQSHHGLFEPKEEQLMLKKVFEFIEEN